MLAADVAVLYVDRNGLYPTLVTHWWDDRRNALTYDLALPVVAHPPCQRWCRLAGLVEARWGHKRGDDGGMFAHALATVRACGGVLEHPAFSDAWEAYGLPRPTSGAGWVQGAASDEWTCYVEQWRYGHPAKKATWLYYCGARAPFELRFGVLDDHAAAPAHSWAGNKGRTNWRDNVRAKQAALVGQLCGPSATVSYLNNNGGRPRPRLTKKQARSTPPDFANVLLQLARWAVAS